MSISNELSSEIAAAILADNRNPQELKALRDVLLEVHSELQRMSDEAREDRLKAKLLAKPRPGERSC
jgi:hypothetical protein